MNPRAPTSPPCGSDLLGSCLAASPPALHFILCRTSSHRDLSSPGGHWRAFLCLPSGSSSSAPRSLVTEHGAPPAWAAVSSQASPAQRPLPLPPSVYTGSSALPQPWGPFQRKQSRRGEATHLGLEAEGTKSGCARDPDGQGCPCVLRSLQGVQGLPGCPGPWVTPRAHVSWADLLQVPYPPSRSRHPRDAPPLFPSLAPGGGGGRCLATLGTGSPVQDLPCRLCRTGDS